MPTKPRLRARIKLVRLDEADEQVGLRFGQVFRAKLCQTPGGAIYYQVDTKHHGHYYLRADQVEATDKGPT